MDTPLIGADLKQIEKSHGVSLNHWVGEIMHIPAQTCYYIQYLTMHLSGSMNAQTELALLALKHGMEYRFHHPYKTIMYSRKKIYKTNEIPHQCYFKVGYSEINKNQEYSNILHKYCDAYHTSDLSGRCSVTSAFFLFNGTLIDWCSKKK